MIDVRNVLEKQRALFATGSTKDVRFRMEKLGALRDAIRAREGEILDALKLDLSKAPFEAYATEVGVVLEEIRHVMRHLRSWARPKRVRTPLVHFLSTSRVYPEPYGSALILSPWNYPFQLTMVPLIGALAAGNCAVVKPSEYSFHTSEVIEKILKDAFDESLVAVARGGRVANATLLDEPFDYIFFTGSPQVGRVVMEAAAKHLTPVTLELGGKSPCIVDETANVALAAKRIAWGKFLNAGQTCVAPDYLLVHRSVKAELLRELQRHITSFYGSDPVTNGEYPKIINRKHFDRLTGLMESGRVAFGGQSDAGTGRIAPTVLEDVTWESAVMREEIFGPLLPVIEFENLEDAIAMVNAHPKPLALYLFTASRESEAHVIRAASFGGGCVNDTVIHFSSPHLPIGGVGNSGMGKYHGKASFDTFTNARGVMKKSNLFDIGVRYPPFGRRLKLLKKLMK